jgi:inner membrane protein
VPTPLTHAIVGAGCASFLPPGHNRAAAAATLGVLAASPDLDLIGYFAGVPYSHLLGHRGLFHSIAFAALIAVVVVILTRAIRSPLGAHTLRLFVVAWAAVASHGILDAMTDGGLGIGLLMPFHSGRSFFAFRPIRVAAISPARFVESASEVLTSEILWVWLPVAVIVGVGWSFRWWSGPFRAKLDAWSRH